LAWLGLASPFLRRHERCVQPQPLKRLPLSPRPTYARSAPHPLTLARNRANISRLPLFHPPAPSSPVPLHTSRPQDDDGDWGGREKQEAVHVRRGGEQGLRVARESTARYRLGEEERERRERGGGPPVRRGWGGRGWSPHAKDVARPAPRDETILPRARGQNRHFPPTRR
jgi:hypothetical protein